MTLNTCASMKLEVHFQRKQVSAGLSRGMSGAASLVFFVTLMMPRGW